jgi:hypothetical protein
LGGSGVFRGGCELRFETNATINPTPIARSNAAAPAQIVLR